MKTKIVGILVCTMLMTTSMVFFINENVNASDGAEDWWDYEWSYCKKITIDRSFVTGDLQNFPVLIHNTSFDFYNHAQYDGDDFVFVSADNMTKYNHEIEKYDGASGELIAWVNVTSLSDSEDTIIWMYYGNPNCGSQQNIPGTWDSNYIHVWHLGDSLSDSAGSDDGNNHGTSLVSGKIGEARSFKRSEKDYIDLGDMTQPGDDSLNTITFECWVKPTSTGTVVTSKYDTSGTDYCSYHISINNDGHFNPTAYEQYGRYCRNTTNDPVVEFGEWNYYTIAFELGSQPSIDIFADGIEVPSTQTKNYNIRWMDNNPVADEIGRARYETHTGYADAVIDEIRWSKIVRSDAWIITTYNTVGEHSNFLSMGLEIERNQPPYSPSNPFPPDGATDVDVNAILRWTCSDPDGDDLTFDVYFGTGSIPPLVSSGQSQDYYDPPGQMEFNTHYYWKIVAWDPHGANTTGPIWDFTTSSEPNDPPDLPSDPNPENGATDVDVNAILSWTCSDPDGDDLVYDVYFEADDPDPDVLVSDDQTGTTYNPGTLLYETTYYWQIIAKDEHGASTPGPIWHFITEELPNEPPDTPIIDGATSGNAGELYEYTFVSTDPDSDEICYFVDWGDDTSSGWSDFVGSGTEITFKHTWSEQGTYTIEAKAKDIFGAESDWAELIVTMPRNRAIMNIPFLNFLQQYPILYQLLQRFLQL